MQEKETIGFQKAYIDYRDGFDGDGGVDPSDVPWLATFEAGWSAHANFAAGIAEFERRKKIAEEGTVKRKGGRKNEVRTPMRKKKDSRKGKKLSAEHRKKISESHQRRLNGLKAGQPVEMGI